jgi:hypothetical protein
MNAQIRHAHLIMDARRNAYHSHTLKKLAQNSLRALKGTLNKNRRLYILECYVADLKEARRYRTKARKLYIQAKAI